MGGEEAMRLWILGRIAALLGIQFKVDGLPYGARHRPSSAAADQRRIPSERDRMTPNESRQDHQGVDK
jgi:hypothetical protein